MRIILILYMFESWQIWKEQEQIIMSYYPDITLHTSILKKSLQTSARKIIFLVWREECTKYMSDILMWKYYALQKILRYLINLC
jgi:hypothetical protein